MKKLFYLIALIMAFLPTQGFSPAEAMQTVKQVDLARYAGDWYEIALIPYFFQNACTANAKVVYTPLSKDVLRDYFECDLKNGQKRVVVGRAKVVDTATNAKLSATFLNLFGWRYWFGDNYWILDLAPDYSHAVVGNPSLKYAWILARTPSLPTETLTRIAHVLKAQGYDPCRLRFSPQTQPEKTGVSQPTPFCDLVPVSPKP